MSSKNTKHFLALTQRLIDSAVKLRNYAVDAHCDALDQEVYECRADCERVASQARALRKAADEKYVLADELSATAHHAAQMARIEKDELRNA